MVIIHSFFLESEIMKMVNVFWLVEGAFLTARVGVVDDGFAPHAASVVLIGANAKLIWGVGLQVVHHRVTGRTRLVDPLPVPLSVADCVKPEGG